MLEMGNPALPPTPRIWPRPGPSPSSCTICVFEDSRVLDEGHVPCIFSQAPATRKAKAGVGRRAQPPRWPRAHPPGQPST